MGNRSVSRLAWIVLALGIGLAGLPAATLTYRAGIPQGKWDGWDDMVPEHIAPDPSAPPERFEVVKRAGNAPRSFSGKVAVDGPLDGVEVGLISLKGIHWLYSDNYQWEPVRPDGTFDLRDARCPDAWKAVALRGPRTAWTFLRHEFAPGEGAKGIVLRAVPSKTVRLTASGGDGIDLTGVAYEPFNARPRYDERGSNLSRQRSDYLESGDAGHLDVVLPIGEVALFVHRAGYAQDYQIVDTTGADHLHFVLRKAGRMHVTVRDAAGKPRGGARVKWINLAAPLSLVDTRTNGDGAIFAGELVPGTFQVDVDGFPRREVKVREGETAEAAFLLGN